MATATDAVRALRTLHTDEATKIARTPTGIEPGFDPTTGITWTEDGRARYRTTPAGGSTGTAQRFYRNTNQSIADDGSYHTVILNHDEFAGADIYSYDNTTGIVTFDEDGRYLAIAFAEFASNATGLRYLSGLPSVIDIRAALSGELTPLNCSALIDANANDTIFIEVKQNSGGSLNLVAASLYLARVAT